MEIKHDGENYQVFDGDKPLSPKYKKASSAAAWGKDYLEGKAEVTEPEIKPKPVKVKPAKKV